MASLETLKQRLRQTAKQHGLTSVYPLSDEQYHKGFGLFANQPAYQDFIGPQLRHLFSTHFRSQSKLSILEIGPGPSSVLESLPERTRAKIERYVAVEPNHIYAEELKQRLNEQIKDVAPFPGLMKKAKIHESRFSAKSVADVYLTETNDKRGFDLILFCHSMYGVEDKGAVIRQALLMLSREPQALILVFHRHNALKFDRLVCQSTKAFPTGSISVDDRDDTLRSLARFITGIAPPEGETGDHVRNAWLEQCRTLGRHNNGRLTFHAPEVMLTFDHHAEALRELFAQMSTMSRHEIRIKNREVQSISPAMVIRPTEIYHIQKCVQWALQHSTSLTVLGGGHSGHCIQPNVVAIDMSAFNQVHVVPDARADSDGGYVVVAGAGCKSKDIIDATMEKQIIVPLGSRPSVGMGLCLQGGIGHHSRRHGLACDAIIGAVLVSVDSGEVLCIGHVPEEHLPGPFFCPEDENDLLWAIKGAGTNFGIIVKVVLKTFEAWYPCVVSKWVVPMSDDVQEVERELNRFNRKVAKVIRQSSSADAYLFRDKDELQLGITTFDFAADGSTQLEQNPMCQLYGDAKSTEVVGQDEMFETDLYMSDMHSGHVGGKTSSFKRCVFLDSIGKETVANLMIEAVNSAPTDLCYIHFLQGGGAMRQVQTDATAFGCRDWDFACVITGVWDRKDDGTEISRTVTEWVYQLVENLIPSSCGVYGADLGPDPRDSLLAAKAFGPNRPQLMRLKRRFEPKNILAYACPFPKPPKLILLIMGESCAGKDFCAKIWQTALKDASPNKKIVIVSISDKTKREYAAAMGCDPDLLLHDRAYKEEHRPKLTAFFEEQLRARPRLLEEQFLNVVHGAIDAEVLIITGMRDEAPVAKFSHLVPDSKVVEVYVDADKPVRDARKTGVGDGDSDGDKGRGWSDGGSQWLHLNYTPHLMFHNNAIGDQAAKAFAGHHLMPFLDEDLQCLAEMVNTTPDFPRKGIDFQHVLGITQKPDGLKLCTSLLKRQYTGDWNIIDAIVSCEAGGFLFGAPLAMRLDKPFIPIRKGPLGKVPPPVKSVPKEGSIIASLEDVGYAQETLEIETSAFTWQSRVVVVDDVLSSGKTLYATLRLLLEAGLDMDNVDVMVVAELPVHRGRLMLHERGFGKVRIQSLLVYGCE